MMQFIHQEINNKKPQNKKRTSSANFNSKKVRTILTTRQTSDQTIIEKQKQTQLPPTVSSKTLNYHRKGNSHIESYKGQANMKKCQNKALLQIIKPIKYEKSKEENLMLKSCDKSKLIYWSNDLKLQGRQKYLLISADLLIDQDLFWDKISTDNGHSTNNSNNFTSVNYNSTTLTRNRNVNLQLPPKFVPLNNNVGLNLPKQSKRNPLMNPNKVNLFIREWKNLHNKVDGQNRKVVVLWLIRKQSTYGQLMEFAQVYQLPLHGIFYVKRKRSNAMFDLGLIVKEINQKFFQTIANPSVNATVVQKKQSPKTLKSIEKNTDFKRSRSKQLKRFVNKQCSELSIELKSDNNLITHKFIKSTKQTKMQQNDQNCAENMNIQTCKQFDLSKMLNGNNKKPLLSIIMDEKRVKKIVKKIALGNEVIKNRPGTTVKIFQSVAQKIQLAQKSSTSSVMSKRYISPLITDNDYQNHTEQIEQLEQNLLQMIDQQKEYAFIESKKMYIRPQIYLFQAVKCNVKDYSGVETYEGRMPLVFNYHEEKYQQVRQKLVKKGVQISESKQNGDNISVFYYKYETLKENMLEKINSLVKQAVISKKDHSQDTNTSFTPAYRLSQYIQTTITNTFTEYSSYMKTKSPHHLTSQQHQKSSPSSQQDSKQITLTQQQQQLIQQKTQKRLQQIKKQLINDVIVMKGRNYTFQNGQSVYYYVGGVFKRNYDMLYNQYYDKYKNQIKVQLMSSNSKQHSGNKQSPILKKGQDENLNNVQNLPKLCNIQFFDFNTY